jgi:hypothetical protein
MKMFILGVLVGAALYGVGDALLSRETSTQAEIAPLSRDVSPQAKIAPPVTEQLPKPPASDGAVASAVRPVPARLDPAADNPRPTGASRDSISVDEKNIRVDDKDLDRVMMELMRRKSKAEQASLDAEPRDPLWSDSMEQQLRLFIERQPNINRVSIKAVDCRTVYCEITAEALVPATGSGSNDAQASFFNAIDEAIKQLGLNRGMSSTSGGGGTPVVFAARFRRFKPGDQCPPGFRQDCWNR